LIIDDKDIKFSDVEFEDRFIVYTYSDVISEKDMKTGKIKNIQLKLVYKDIPTKISYKIEIKKANIPDVAEVNDTNQSSFIGSLYKRGAKVYSEYNSKIQFIPTTIEMGDKCFDIINDLTQCKSRK